MFQRVVLHSTGDQLFSKVPDVEFVGLWSSWVKENPRYSDCLNERMCDLRYVILWCEMMLETQPKIYVDEYQDTHAEAINNYQIELKHVRTKN